LKKNRNKQKGEGSKERKKGNVPCVWGVKRKVVVPKEKFILKGGSGRPTKKAERGLLDSRGIKH